MTERTLILPIDIKSREMDARLLHAAFALHAGWQVITGSKTLINRRIWTLPEGVYLFSTLAPGRLKMARWLKAMGFASQGWDEEGLIYGDRALYRRSRLSAATMARIDQIFAWGESSAEDVRLVAQQVGKEVEVAGNPRLDLLRPPMLQLHAEESERLKQEHGDFVLFATNLSWANPHVLPPEQRDLHGDKPPPGKEGAYSYLQYQKRMLAAMRQAVADVARAFPELTIIIRPHPVESLQTWRQWTAPLKNVKVIREGNILAWTLAARTLVHSNSTTGLEARLMGRHPVAFVPFEAPRHESPLPNGVSLRAQDSRQLIEQIAAVLEGRAQLDAHQQALLHHHLHLPEGMCTPHFVKRAQALLPLVRRQRLKAAPLRGWLILREWHKRMRRNHPRDIHRRNIFPDTPLAEVQQRFARIATAAGLPEVAQARIEELSPNIFRLRPATTPASSQ